MPNQVIWHLIVSCDVRRISGTDEFDVHWFHKNNENEIIDLGQVEVQGESANRELVVFGTQLINTPFNEFMLGEYWCQVIVTSTQPNTYLGKSDILVVRDPRDYDTGLPRCQGVITVSTSKCADGIQSSLCVSSSSSCTNPTITEEVQLSATASMSSFSTSSSLTFFYSSSSTSSFSSSLSNSQTNLKPYSSIQITPSNSLLKSDDSGLASYYIVIIIVIIIIIILLGILLVISCLVILCIKRKKKIEDTIYYGKLIITLCIIYHFYVYGYI